MIDRIISIRNLGRFASYQACGDVAMQKLTLIYGENGRGKTTLCALLRSLMTGYTPPLQSRQTVGQANQPTAEVLANSQNHRLLNGTWSALLPDIAIFDSEFVHQNVYSGDHIAHEHRCNSYRIIIGAQGVPLAQQIDQLTTEISTANTALRRLREQVQRYIEGNISLEEFLQIAQVTDVDARIQVKEAEVQAIERRTKQGSQIQSKGQLQALTAPALPTGVDSILSRTLPDVSADAETRVRDHIKQNLDANGEGWLESGTRYATGDDCPFCGQTLTNSGLIALYRSYFNEAYRQLKRDVSALPNFVTAILSGNAISVMARVMATNAELMAFWGQFINIPLPVVPTERLQEVLVTAATALSASVAAKQRAPLDAVSMPDQWQAFQDQLEVGCQAIIAYNQSVQEINAAIADLKQPQRPDDTTAIMTELEQLKLAKRRYEPGVVVDCGDLIDKINRKQQLENQKATVRTQLDQHCQAVLEAHQVEINHYLAQFNTSFRIANTRHHYVGGTPSSHFQIEINNEALDLGDDRTPETTPCFKTALSSGDRSALALAFFLATLRRDPNLADKIVILDDPFSSQDRFRRAATQYLIARLTEDCEQVIVLSHDPQFLDAVEQDTHSIGISRLQASAVGDNVEITKCNLEAIIGCSLAAERTRLTAYVSAGQGTLIDIARAIRPMLEGHLRQAAHGAFNGMIMLGDMIAAIRCAEPGDAIHRFAQFADELDQINRYARAFHHPQGHNAPVPQIDGEELKGYASRALHFVGGV